MFLLPYCIYTRYARSVTLYKVKPLYATGIAIYGWEFASALILARTHSSCGICSDEGSISNASSSLSIGRQEGDG